MYRLTYGRTTEPYRTGTQAIRALARAVRAQPLTTGEREAFNRWYVLRNYRSVAQSLRKGHRYEIRVSIAGERRIFAVAPPPPHPLRHAPQVPVTRQDLPA